MRTNGQGNFLQSQSTHQFRILRTHPVIDAFRTQRIECSSNIRRGSLFAGMRNNPKPELACLREYSGELLRWISTSPESSPTPTQRSAYSGRNGNASSRVARASSREDGEAETKDHSARKPVFTSRLPQRPAIPAKTVAMGTSRAVCVCDRKTTRRDIRYPQIARRT